MKLHVRRESWPLREPFRIAGHVQTQCEVVLVELEADGFVGRGEAKGVHYLGDDADAAYVRIVAIASEIEGGLAREELQVRLPPGGARNALDCALWDLELKRAGVSIWSRLGVTPKPLAMPQTIGIAPTIEAMVQAARQAPSDVLKIKLDAEDVTARVAAVRAARPDARLFVDANQSWTFAQLQAVAPRLAALGVLLIEQPLPHGGDGALDRYDCPVPLCADESCQSSADLEVVAGRYQMANIKLDKAGGLTEALRMMQRCDALGLRAMVGCMVSTSLAIAPAFVAAQTAVMADLDGATFLTTDRPHGMPVEAGHLQPPKAVLWG